MHGAVLKYGKMKCLGVLANNINLGIAVLFMHFKPGVFTARSASKTLDQNHFSTKG